MKKILLLIFIVLGNVQVKAQQGESSGLTTEQLKVSADQESMRLHRTLLLNENQYNRVKEINWRRRQSLTRVQALFPQEPEKRDDKIYEMETQYDAEFSTVLTKKQFDEYLELNGRGPSAEPRKPKAGEGPSFNEKVHAIISNATKPASDSNRIAMQEDLATDSLAVFGNPVPNDAPHLKAVQDTLKETPLVKDANLQISLTVKDLEGEGNKPRKTPVVSENMGQKQPGESITKPGNGGTKKAGMP